MQKQKVIEDIKLIVKEVLGFETIGEHENLLSLKPSYPVVYLLYVLERLADIYGEALYEIFEINDYKVLELDTFAEAIMEKCTEAPAARKRA